MKLYQQIGAIMNKRISSNEEIISRIADWKINNTLDEPKKIALLALVLDRLGKLEDEADMQISLQLEQKSVEATYTCNQCDKVCLSKIGLISHMKSHEIKSS